MDSSVKPLRKPTMMYGEAEPNDSAAAPAIKDPRVTPTPNVHAKVFLDFRVTFALKLARCAGSLL